MGLLTGEISGATLGKDLYTKTRIPAYGHTGYLGIQPSPIGYIDAGSFLGTCDDTADHTFFGGGNFWLHFPPPVNDLGDITTDFWVLQTDAITTADGVTVTADGVVTKQIADAAGAIGDTATGFFSNIRNIIILVIILAAILIGLFIYFNYGR